MNPLVVVICAFLSGVLGTAMGAVAAVIMAAIVALIGIAANICGADYNLVGSLAFGMFWGPQVSFGPACCAVSYAAKKGYLPDGDIFTPMINLHKPDALLVGGVFAVVGWYLNQGIATVLGGKIDTVALTIVLIMMVAKVLFCGSLFGTVEGGKARFALDSPCWLPWQTSSTGYHMLLIGLSAGGLASYIVIEMCTLAQQTGNQALADMAAIPVWTFALIAFLIFATGRNIPVFHHIGLVAGYATQMAFNGGGGSASFLWGLAFGLLSAYVAEWLSKVFHVNGMGYVDPPSLAIAVLSPFTMAIFPAMGMNQISSPMFYAIPAIILVALCAYGVICERKAKEMKIGAYAS